MGCDIHWLIERKSDGGIWHLCASETALWAKHWSQTVQPSWEERDRLPEWQLSWRDYDLFGLLSDVRGNAGEDGPITEKSWPSDRSIGAQEEYEAKFQHSDCWLPGFAFLDKSSRLNANKITRKWANRMMKALKRGIADQPLGPLVNVDGEWGPAEFMGRETGHEAVHRIAQARKLLPLTDPDAWRVLIWYDS